nr:hypothetical protein [Tanacetum cinerariifolium]
MALPPREQRYQYLSYEGLQYTDTDIVYFESRLARIYQREIGISSAGDFLSTTPSYTVIRDLILRLCHRLIACSIPGRSQAPEKGLTVIAPALLVIDMAELVRLQICEQLDDTWAWVALGPERQPDAVASAPGREVIDEMAHDFSIFSTWAVTSLARMMDRAGVTYTSYSETPREYQRRMDR